MGGAVATYSVEQHPELFAGALCIGAALLVKDDEAHIDAQRGAIQFTHSPERPILFLTNISEVSAARHRYLSGLPGLIASPGVHHQ